MLAIEPDAPNRLLAGQEPRYRVRPVTTGIQAIDKMGILEISWYTGQLKRIGRGRLPWPHEPALLVFLKLAWGFLRAGRKKRRPTRLRAN
jgi:hypothetical protein